MEYMNIGPYIAEKVSDKAQEEFGKELFGYFTGKEVPDTPKEKKLYLTLRTWIAGNSTETNGARIFKALEPFKKDYPEILIPNVKKIYRGITADYNSIEDKFGIKSDDIVFDKPMRVTYRPHKEYQSWSDDKDIAIDFADENVTAGSITCLLELVNPNKNSILFNPVFMDKLGDSTVGNGEREIIHKGKIIKCNLIVPDEYSNRVVLKRELE